MQKYSSVLISISMLRNNEISPCPLTPFDSTAHQTTYVRSCLFTTPTHLDPSPSFRLSFQSISRIICGQLVKGVKTITVSIEQHQQLCRSFVLVALDTPHRASISPTVIALLPHSINHPPPLHPILAEEFNWIVEMIATSKKRTQVQSAGVGGSEIRTWSCQVNIVAPPFPRTK